MRKDPLGGRAHADLVRLAHLSRREIWKSVLVLALAASFVVFLIGQVLGLNLSPTDPVQAKRALIVSGIPTARAVAETYEQQHNWLLQRGGWISIIAFEHLGGMLLEGATQEIHKNRNFSTWRSELSQALLRIGFVVLATWRFWLLAVIIAIGLGISNIRLHRGNDILGQTSNGHLFHSGIRASLDPCTPAGEPEFQVTGLACPAQTTARVMASMSIGHLLQRYQAANTTTYYLAGVIHAHRHFPAFVPNYGEEAEFDHGFVGAKLFTATEAILETLLTEHANLKGTNIRRDSTNKTSPTKIENEQSSQSNSTGANTDSKPDTTQPQLDLVGYCKLLQSSAQRVLTSEQRTQLAKISTTELATTILAVQAGKTLAYTFGGGRWIRQATFPQLSARAVLHSAPTLASDFNYQSRMCIRRALIYAHRASIFGPVRFPIDLDGPTKALRQWSELLFMSPHRLVAGTAEVELHGLASKLNQRLQEEFAARLRAEDPTLVKHCITTGGSIFLMPAADLLALSRQVLEPHELKRLKQLVGQVHQQQTTTIRQDELETAENLPVPDYERILPCFDQAEIKDLAKFHQLDEKDVDDWSALRSLLNLYGWLGKRVGDASVSDRFLVVADLLPRSELPTKATPIERRGLVVLRATRLTQELGIGWQKRLCQFDQILIADSETEYNSILRSGSTKAPDTKGV